MLSTSSGISTTNYPPSKEPIDLVFVPNPFPTLPFLKRKSLAYFGKKKLDKNK
jgi:hypothetical protein